MATGSLKIDLDALTRNWLTLNELSAAHVRTAATIKADGYGLGAERVALALVQAGVRQFFVAAAEEAVTVRAVLGPKPWIGVFSGHMPGDTEIIAQNGLVPMLNSPEQVARHLTALPDHPFGIQLDSGMNRLGLEPAEWRAVRERVLMRKPVLIMSHLACADEPDNPMNAQQRKAFEDMTSDLRIPRSLAATGGVLLGKDYHYEMTRPGIGLYGGEPFSAAAPVVRLAIPIIQTRTVEPGEAVGYGRAWIAKRRTRIATVAAGYADGLIRAMSNNVMLWSGDTPCPLVGRVSMDMLTVDVTEAEDDISELELINPRQSVDTVADAAGTIGYEILTSLGHRYKRDFGT